MARHPKLASALLMLFWLVFIVFTVTEAAKAVTVSSTVAGMVVVKVTVEEPLLRDATTAPDVMT